MIGGIEQYGRLGTQMRLCRRWRVCADGAIAAEQRLLAAEKVHSESRVDRLFVSLVSSLIGVVPSQFRSFCFVDRE